MRKPTVEAVVLALLALTTGTWADPLPGYHDFFIDVANGSNTFYMDFPSPGKGLNAEWVGPAGLPVSPSSKTGLTTISTNNPSVTGSLAAYETGSGGSGVEDFVLLLSVAGPISHSFGSTLTWGTSNSLTFTSSNFILRTADHQAGSECHAPVSRSKYFRPRDRGISYVCRPPGGVTG